MAARESWKSIALALAMRVENLVPCEPHGWHDHHEECPGCQDVAVYRRFERRLAEDGQRLRPPPDGESIPVRKMRRTL